MQHVKRQEKYMQSTFQVNHDLGYSADHTHKHAKLMIPPKRDEKLFTASYTVVSMLGKIISSR